MDVSKQEPRVRWATIKSSASTCNVTGLNQSQFSHSEGKVSRCTWTQEAPRYCYVPPGRSCSPAALLQVLRKVGDLGD